MRKRIVNILSCFFLVLLTITSVYVDKAYSGVLVIGRKAVSYDDITFYHDCDALDDANLAAGSSTVTYSAGILLETSDPILGTGSWDNNNDGYDNVDFATSGNIDMTNGRMGLYTNFQEIASGQICFSDVSNDFRVNYSSSTLITVNWRGLTAGTGIGLSKTLSTGVDYYWEFAFDGDTVYVYLDGVLQGSKTSTAQAITSTVMSVGASSSSSWDSFYDQVICSSNKDRDLYAIRDVTNFS